MPPDKRSGPHASTGRRQPPQTTTATITDGADGARRCDQCGGPLAPRRRRFCTDECRRRGQKAERIIEDTDYAAGVKRLVRASARRAGADLAMFAMFAEAVDYARARLADAAEQLITQGYSYSNIARELGITRQAAWKRFGRKPEVDAGTPSADGTA
jgi:hypothetical protein